MGGSFDPRQSGGGRGFDQRQNTGFDQRQNRGFDQRPSLGDSFDQRQNVGSAFDQRTPNAMIEFDQRSGTFGQQHNSGGFDQRNSTTAIFGRGPSGDRGEYGGDCYEEDFEYDQSGRRNSLDNGAAQFQGQPPSSAWVGDSNN